MSNGRQQFASALVKNAADPRQVKFGEQFERRQQDRLNSAIGDVMATPSGRIVMSLLLRQAGLYREIWRPGSEIHYTAAQHDFAVQWMLRLRAVDEELVLQMEREDAEWARREQATIEASHTRRRPKTEEENDGS